MRKAVFMDKDGTLIPDIPFNVNPDLITISKDTIRALRQIRQQGYMLIVVSNQSGVARGYFTDEQLMLVWERINELLAEEDLAADAFYYCPHSSAPALGTDNILCQCRKPKPGMLLEAASDYDLDLAASWMIGDILDDVEAGNRAGCRSVLLDNGNETEWKMSALRRPSFTIKNLGELIEIISEHEKEVVDLPGNYQSFP